MTTPTDTARNATLADLGALLTDQQARKVDLVLPATKLRAEGGAFRVDGADLVMDDDGVTDPNGMYRPTSTCDAHVSEKLGIPLKYVRRLRAERPDMWDANVNGWLHGSPDQELPSDLRGAHGDTRSFMLRTFRSAVDGEPGIARALLGDRYGIVDHIDMLTATLAGIRDSGANVEIVSCDLTETRMYVQVACPDFAVLAPTLLAGYRSPNGGWTLESARAAARKEGMGYPEGQEPVVFAGFVISNSETGGGAATITPRMVVQPCKNGLTIGGDVVRAIHVGNQLDQGIVRWSETTARRQVDLITSKAKDAVATFLDREYVEQAIRGMEEKAGKPVTDAEATITAVGKKLNFTEAETKGVFAHFLKGSMYTASGVMQAVTAYAQDVPNADSAYDLEAKAVAALEAAYALA